MPLVRSCAVVRVVKVERRRAWVVSVSFMVGRELRRMGCEMPMPLNGLYGVCCAITMVMMLTASSELSTCSARNARLRPGNLRGVRRSFVRDKLVSVWLPPAEQTSDEGERG